jgi:hypothetical protein
MGTPPYQLAKPTGRGKGLKDRERQWSSMEIDDLGFLAAIYRDLPRFGAEWWRNLAFTKTGERGGIFDHLSV